MTRSAKPLVPVCDSRRCFLSAPRLVGSCQPSLLRLAPPGRGPYGCRPVKRSPVNWIEETAWTPHSRLANTTSLTNRSALVNCSLPKGSRRRRPTEAASTRSNSDRIPKCARRKLRRYAIGRIPRHGPRNWLADNGVAADTNLVLTIGAGGAPTGPPTSGRFADRAGPASRSSGRAARRRDAASQGRGADPWPP